jgi:cytochrome o ubiquinol oxidase subunit 2
MSRKYQWLLVGSLLLLGWLFYLIYDYSDSIAMLNPKGLIALKERNLIYTALLLMLLVVIPVFILTIYVSVKYRADNKDADYTPEWDNSNLLEVIWWGFPFLIIFILSILTWTSSHELDPFKPLDSEVKPLRIQVVAMRWKWLFIYPEQNIASVNFFQFPEKTPINFEITSDAPMNSFWIPQIGGQIYAMPGMKTKLHLIADHVGDYNGASANISGTGFAGMTFVARASTPGDFEKWVETVRQSGASFDKDQYKELAKPSSYNPVATFKLANNELFDWVVMKPMMNMD